MFESVYYTRNPRNWYINVGHQFMIELVHDENRTYLITPSFLIPPGSQFLLSTDEFLRIKDVIKISCWSRFFCCDRKPSIHRGGRIQILLNEHKVYLEVDTVRNELYLITPPMTLPVKSRIPLNKNGILTVLDLLQGRDV